MRILALLGGFLFDNQKISNLYSYYPTGYPLLDIKITKNITKPGNIYSLFSPQ